MSTLVLVLFALLLVAAVVGVIYIGRDYLKKWTD